ncbi:Aste57867_5967 [Aphanomyces stellatus]|uniref:Aste57867_5967 protein n=1 Tax=Aphanomyces stellatus TaxID=120398 RepID=A0A485KFB9_9STRA|nr:hypothetical protein As57867_005953 [Aphanomyces stellatus]VFT82984.1 Aste57867_5967 [Aphanomyces stellatus]
MSKGANFVVALVAVLAYVYLDVLQKHPLYEEHVAPLVQEHVTPLYEQHVAPLYAQHVAPLVDEHVTPLYQQHVAPLVKEHVEPLVRSLSNALTPETTHAKTSGVSTSDVDEKKCNALAAGHLTDVKPIEGFHVLCLGQSSKGIVGFAYTEGLNTKAAVPFETPSTTWEDVKAAIAKAAQIKAPETEHEIKFKQPWALFTPDGVRVTSLDELKDVPIAYVMEGGQFIWPGIRIGHKRVIPNLNGLGDVTLETLEMTPLVFGVDEFLRDDEIDVILDLSMEHLAPSGVTHNDDDVGKPATEWRTSTTYFLSSKRNPAVLNGIDQRVEDLTKVDKANQEDVQVLRYELTQKYDAHLDYFSIDQLTKNPQMVASLDHGFKNRMITVFWYMSDVAEGGHTNFPRAGGAPQPYDFTDCSKGLSVTPKKRKVVVFYSMLPSGRGDVYSLHGGCPVLDGVKYSGNKWIWNKPFTH